MIDATQPLRYHPFMRKFTEAELAQAQRMISSRNGKAGTGECKKRGGRDYYARLGRKSALARKQNRAA